MSGGPIGFFGNDEDDGEAKTFNIVAIRSGPRWGALRKILNQVGTAETPTSFFIESYENLERTQ